MSYPLVAISDFCQTGSGATPLRKESSYYNGDIPWIKSGELRENEILCSKEFVTEKALRETALKRVPAGSILVAMYGATVGRVGILGIDATTNQAVCHIIPDKNQADTRYMFHALQCKAAELVSRGVGGAQPNISQGVIKETKIPLPSLEEQKRIAAILDQADSLRRLRQRAIDRLNSLGQAIFYEMFGDPGANPKGWDALKIGDLAASTQYGTSSKAGGEGEYPILRMNNLTYDGKMDLGNLKYIDLANKEIDKYTVVSGDILFNRTNSADLVGKTAVYRGKSRLAFAGYLVRLRTNEKAVPDYISGFLNCHYGKAVLRGMCKSIIGMANINAKELCSIAIPVPPISLQEQYAERIMALSVSAHPYHGHLRSLASLFSSLQHRAFRGEL